MIDFYANNKIKMSVFKVKSLLGAQIKPCDEGAGYLCGVTNPDLEFGLKNDEMGGGVYYKISTCPVKGCSVRIEQILSDAEADELRDSVVYGNGKAGNGQKIIITNTSSDGIISARKSNAKHRKSGILKRMFADMLRSIFS